MPQVVFRRAAVHGRRLPAGGRGSTSDPKTVAAQVDKIRNRFGLRRVVLVGDRGMLTGARIREDLQGIDGLRWITTLRAPTIRKLKYSALLDDAEGWCDTLSNDKDAPTALREAVAALAVPVHLESQNKAAVDRFQPANCGSDFGGALTVSFLQFCKF